MTYPTEQETSGNGPISAFVAACAEIPDAGLRVRGAAFLASFATCGRYAPAMADAGLRATDLQTCRRSPAFAQMQDDLAASIGWMRTAEVEDVLARLAVGEMPFDRDRVRPSVRAASLYLPANAERYRRDGRAAGPSVSLVVNL